jgi:hypothetical protein
VATQRITIAKVAGRTAEALRHRFLAWSAARTVRDPDVWSAEQWPGDCRQELDTFATKFRAESHVPPVIYFTEHIDMWSMGDFFRGCLPAGSHTFLAFGDRFELACYTLPDDGSLAESLKKSLKREQARKNPAEENWFHVRLSEAVRAWVPLVTDSVIVILREVLDATVTDIEIQQSLLRMPPWIGPG